MKVENTLKNFSKRHLPKVDQTMATFLKNETNESILLEAMMYSVRAGGKRIRPLLLLATLDFFHRPLTDAAYQAAAAIEMIHTYSLIHDDLPAMDNDDLRRGLPTNHKVFGDALAILAGDGLLTEAFHLLSRMDEVNPVIQVRLIRQLAAASGAKGMIAGQVADIEGENQHLSLTELQQIHERKTGALIRCAVEAGLLLGDVSEECEYDFLLFAKHLGIAFQIRDDLLDVVGDVAVLGKNVGMDEALQKTTYPSLLGVEGAKIAFEEQWQMAMDLLSQHKDTKEVTVLEQIVLDLKKIK